jgi:two-component system sensor histidine kinase KdpD
VRQGSRPEDFLELVERSRRGRLKIYLGFAAGVGKTFRMLEEAHSLKARGVDVVLAFIETHGRPETTRLLEGLEAVPRKVYAYKGMSVEEMDLDAVIARKPQVAIVDEVAHTNAPEAKNGKRFQDVLTLLDAGINVLCAFNIQHLESVAGVVERVTQVPVRERVPDAFLTQADQTVNLDLAVEDLQERLRAGKIYQPEKVQVALEGFFRADNLATLRELSLREVAESLDRQFRAQKKASPGTDAPARGVERIGARVMVCLSSSPPRATALMLRGSRLAGRLNTSWFVVYVETPNEAPDRIDSEAQRHLLTNIDKARELGGEIVRLRSSDPVAAILDFARSHGVGHIIVGRTKLPWWRTVLGRSVMHRLVDEAAGFDLHIVSFEDEEPGA